MPTLLQITPVEMVLRVASATVGASEVPPNTNTGLYVERVLARTRTPKGNPWCASWVSDVGAIALGAEWPVVLTASVQAMCDWARDKGCRYVATKVPPLPGDLFALWFPSLKRYAHVGIVWSVNADGTVQSLEGNTSQPGDNNPATQREGWCVAQRIRTLTDRDRLIRWTEAMLGPA